MLIVKVFINDKQIDEINIHNTGMTDELGDHIYELTDNKDRRIINHFISHNRTLGYRKLLVKALNLLNKYKIKETYTKESFLKNYLNFVFKEIK